MKRLVKPVLTSALTIALGACASTPAPQELLNARSAYDRAVHSSAGQLAPADVENARQALALAESAHQDSPGEQSTRDLAYVAERRAFLALAQGRAAEDAKARIEAEQALKQAREDQLNQTQAALNSETRKTSAQAQQIAAEQAARANAEARARDAVQRLSALAAIKEEQRGTVITLNGSVLFATNQNSLLGTAQERLNQVAEVLKEQPDLNFTVIGHTDSQGNDDYNMQLSQKRADAVRDYLVSRGVDASHIRSVGRGKNEPIADNASAEGRANNRRVEIVLSAKGFESDAHPANAPSTSTVKVK